MGDNDRIRSLVPLKIFTAASTLIGILICAGSTLYWTNLYENDVYGYKNETILETCQTSPDLRLCEFLRTWKSCATVGIVVGVIQTLVSVVSLIFRRVSYKTRLTCAAHGFAIVALAPIFILTLSYNLNPALERVPNKQEILFISITAIDLFFSLFYTVYVYRSYGLEFQPFYSRLNSFDRE